MTAKLIKCFDPWDLSSGPLNRQSQAPQSEEELQSCTQLILAHFTSSIFLDEILQYGLQPDTDKSRATEDGIPSDNSSVYLAASLDPFYLERVVKKQGGSGIVIVVQVERARLLPDEAALIPQDRQNTTMETQLYLSLSFGACKHLGPISKNQILGIYHRDGAIIQTT